MVMKRLARGRKVQGVDGKKGKTAAVHIGTSGWNYDHWKEVFYPVDLPSDRWLRFYGDRFRSVEINNTFYNLPEKKTFENWRRETPDGFIFAVKASRYITHMKKLKEPVEAVRRFMDKAYMLDEKLGPVLFQLPPHWRCNPERLDSFLELLPREHRYTFEFRDKSWFREEVYEVLRKHKAALCIYQLSGFLSPKELTAEFTYIRLHGPGAAYEGSYGSSTLAGWAETLSSWSREGMPVYCYFDNDQHGYAAQNALWLQSMLQE
jgi:uncharacterized protein YecE (DUF72 family)